MKLKGVKTSANVAYCILPRTGTENLEFRFDAILDMSPFERLCPLPKPPIRIMANGSKQAVMADPTYIIQVTQYAEKKSAWMFLTSIAGTVGLEWEKVNLQDSDTWLLYKEELQEGGFCDAEVNRMFAAFAEANALNEHKVQEAREAFLRGLEEAAANTSGPNTELNSTLSGEAANALGSPLLA